MTQEKGTIHTKYDSTKLGEIKKCLHTIKIKKPEQVKISNRINLKSYSKKSEVGQAIVHEHPGLSWEDFDHKKFVEVRAAFVEWMNSLTTKEIYTKIEMNNLLRVLKWDVVNRLKKAIAKNEPLSKADAERADKLFEHLSVLHKLKYGEKRINVKADFKFIQNMT